MNMPNPHKILPDASKAVSKTTTVFVSGNSQAVRLPKEFRFNSKTVEISRRGEEIVLRERRPSFAEVLADLPVLNNQHAAQMDEFIKAIKADPLTMEERDFSWMDEAPPTLKAHKKTAKTLKSVGKKRV